ncbi:MAG: adenylate/guanylate cyclase domain-containing protein [Desulfofustis sp.]|nr:adenylate/guanylate cyclase domain-containing protein [Desulfofustis sp.]
MKRLRQALIFGISIGIAAVLLLLSPLGQGIEDEFGLELLFKIRGSIEPPADVVIVNIDDQSSELLELDSKIEDWPRTIYADLVEVLTQFGAAVIVFDIHFGDPHDEASDHRFAEAMRKNGRVILYQKLVRMNKGKSADQRVSSAVEIEQLVPPAPLLTDAALASAPFPIPKIPRRINQSWTFKASAGDMPTLPVVALQAAALPRYEAFYDHVKTVTGSGMGTIPRSVRQATEEVGLIETMHRYRQLLHPASAVPRPLSPDGPGTSSPEVDPLFRSLVKTYCGANNVYVNFYGPPATLVTYSLQEVLSGSDRADLKTAFHNKVVFIGAAKTTTWSEQNDGVFTVFTQADGLDLSGVEVAASVFANLLHDTQLKLFPVSLSILLLICSATIYSIISFTLPPIISIATLLILIGSGLFTADHFFSLNQIWLPVITWLILLPPVIFFSAIIIRFIGTQRERTHIKKALSLYLPHNVVEEISSDLTTIRTGDQMVYGVCLATDAQNYTTLSERLDPKELSAVMKNYFELMFGSVNRHGGLICNVVGDAMFSMWPSTDPSSANKEHACSAALDIFHTIESFNRSHPQRALPTRIGLHSGNLLMGNIGAEGHYEYAPVGDIVNTASRIENINKNLGTWILASEETIQQCSSIATRLMGSFLMSGKKRPVTLYQLLPYEITSADTRSLYDDAFPGALKLFQQKRWKDAETAFRKCLDLDPADGPSRLYLQLSSEFRLRPPGEDWDGIISLQK